MKRQAWVLLLVIAVWPPSASGNDKGRVLDRPALAQVESYCVDIAGLADDEVYLVRGFLKEQGKPKGLLKDLRWKRVEDCVESEPDATIRIEFPFLNAVELRAGEARASAFPRANSVISSRRCFACTTVPRQESYTRQRLFRSKVLATR
jgi:hypothetical protein